VARDFCSSALRLNMCSNRECQQVGSIRSEYLCCVKPLPIDIHIKGKSFTCGKVFEDVCLLAKLIFNLIRLLLDGLKPIESSWRSTSTNRFSFIRRNKMCYLRQINASSSPLESDSRNNIPQEQISRYRPSTLSSWHIFGGARSSRARWMGSSDPNHIGCRTVC
jgi:hypothetical protein